MSHTGLGDRKAASNNGMHPTLASEALIIKLPDFCYLACCALASGG
jgi:hypothetical protein